MEQEQRSKEKLCPAKGENDEEVWENADTCFCALLCSFDADVGIFSGGESAEEGCVVSGGEFTGETGNIWKGVF